MAVGEGKIRVTADTSDAQRALGDLNRALDNLKSSTGKAAAAFAAVTGAAAGIAYVVKQTLDAAGNIMDAANAIGVSAASLNTLQTAASLAGVGADELNSSLVRLNKSIGEGLSKGTGPAVQALKQLNVPIAEIARMRPDQQFTVLAQKLNEIENPAQRTAAAMELFGKQGPRILAVANELEKVKQITTAIGFGLSDIELQALDEASDSLDQIRIIWDAGIKKAVAEVAPYIVAIVNKIKEGIVAAGGFDGIWQGIKSITNTVLNIMLAIAAVMAVRMVAAAVAFAMHLGRALVTARGIATVLARTPIGLITAGLAFAADKLGIDIVGGFTDALDTSLDLKTAQDQINKALEEKNAKLDAGVSLMQGFNEEQQKVLDALDETIAKKQTEIQYQQDLLNLGSSEAAIKKALNEEDAKAKKVGISLSNEEYQTKRKQLEIALRSEESLKRQVTLQKEQSAAIWETLGNVTAVGKEVEKMRVMRLSFQGFTQDDIKRMDEMAATLPGIQEAALKKQQERINREVSSEFGKYNELIAAEVKYQDAKNSLREIENMNRIGQIALTVEQQTQLNESLKALDAQYADERIKAQQAMSDRLLQIEINRIQQVLQANKSGIAQQLSDADSATLQRAGQEERQKQIVADRIAFEKKSDAEKYAFGIDQAAQMFTALGAQNKKAFEAAKAFNIANAIMNTYMAATKALATYPPPFNFIAMAAAIGMGMAQVAQIRSQQYSGRALGGPVMGGQSYIVGENGPELFTPNTTGSITRNQDLQGGGSVNVNFSINAVDTAGFDELLNSRRGLITQVISDAMVEKGQRGL